MYAVAIDALKETLERVYRRYNHRRFIGADPLQFAYRFSKPQDIEIAAFLASSLAYGRVQQIERSVNDLLDRMDNRPYNFVRTFSDVRRKRLVRFKHRFTTGETLADLMALLRDMLREYGTLEAFFASGDDPAASTVAPALARFCDRLSNAYARRHDGRASRGLKYLLASPTRGSASKRLNLFLRWMVRSDAVDPGLWKSIDPARLIVPMDVHMARLCAILGLYEGRTVSLSTAVQVTESFARMEPADPVKYDFALSRIGILDDCNGRRRSECPACQLYPICLERENWTA